MNLDIFKPDYYENKAKIKSAHTKWKSDVNNYLSQNRKCRRKIYEIQDLVKKNEDYEDRHDRDMPGFYKTAHKLIDDIVDDVYKNVERPDDIDHDTTRQFVTAYVNAMCY